MRRSSGSKSSFTIDYVKGFAGSVTVIRGLAQTFLTLTIEGAPPLSRLCDRAGTLISLRFEDRSQSQIPRPVPAKSAGTTTGQAQFRLCRERLGQLAAHLKRYVLVGNC